MSKFAKYTENLTPADIKLGFRRKQELRDIQTAKLSTENIAMLSLQRC